MLCCAPWDDYALRYAAAESVHHPRAAAQANTKRGRLGASLRTRRRKLPVIATWGCGMFPGPAAEGLGRAFLRASGSARLRLTVIHATRGWLASAMQRRISRRRLGSPRRRLSLTRCRFDARETALAKGQDGLPRPPVELNAHARASSGSSPCGTAETQPASPDAAELVPARRGSLLCAARLVLALADCDCGGMSSDC